MGVGLAGLAGCAGVDVPWEEDAPAYNRNTLQSLATRDLPSIPTVVSEPVSGDLAAAFREDARTRLESVPSDPVVPNEMLASRLAKERADALERLGDETQSRTPYDRLGSAGYDLAKAAEVEAAFRAATGDIDPSTIRADREQVQRDLYDFLAAWEYRGPDPLEAIAFHRRLENVVEDARRATRPAASIPDDPRDDPLLVGSIVGEVVRGQAALQAADRLRTGYVDGLTDPTPYREAIISRSYRAMHWLREYGYRLRDYFDEHGNRNVDSPTPAEYLFREAELRQSHLPEQIERERGREHYADAIVTGANVAATALSARAAIQTVRDGAFPPPESADQIVAEYEQAAAAIRSAVATEPTAITPIIGWYARDLLDQGRYHLEDVANGSPQREAYRAVALFRLGRLYAAAIPQAAREVASWFGE